jgi:hypothetical protein
MTEQEFVVGIRDCRARHRAAIAAADQADADAEALEAEAVKRGYDVAALVQEADE